MNAPKLDLPQFELKNLDQINRAPRLFGTEFLNEPMKQLLVQSGLPVVQTSSGDNKVPLDIDCLQENEGKNSRVIFCLFIETNTLVLV